jgi:hypothetical protein
MSDKDGPDLLRAFRVAGIGPVSIVIGSSGASPNA